MKAELLVVDDHSLILEGICKIVNKMPEVTVADAVTSGKQAIKLIFWISVSPIFQVLN